MLLCLVEELDDPSDEGNETWNCSFFFKADVKAFNLFAINGAMQRSPTQSLLNVM